MKSILDPSFQYTPSYSTNIRETFAKARQEINLKAKGAKPVTLGDLLKQHQELHQQRLLKSVK